MGRLGAVFLLAALVCAAAGPPRFLGPEPCGLCHKNIAAQQERTAMAATWQSGSTRWLAADFDAAVAADLPYEIKRSADSFLYSVTSADGRKTTLPIDVLMGGRRHGLGFLAPIREVDGIALSRPALIQARYAWSPEQNKLLLAPGCSGTRPQSLESTLGLVLSPTFEARCLSCHGQPNLAGSGKSGGVHCESCHGPGSDHLLAVSRGDAKKGIINPRRMSADDSIGVCAGCHVGLARFSDPSAEDLLVANQAPAIRNSECFLQSGKAFSCTTCHDPHTDAVADDQRAVRACLGCHAGGVKRHAAICPVNAATGCVGCHMPSVEMGPLHLVDHLIRVHPEQKNGEMPKPGLSLRTQITPVSEYLRRITLNSLDAATIAQQRLMKGEPFYKVARDVSVDETVAIGGYLGLRDVAGLGSHLSENAARLGYGETSQPVQIGQQWLILQRLPRDFRWDAEQLQKQAEELGAHGDWRGAIEKAQQAVMIYPRYLRAITFIGVTFAQSGNLKKGAEVLVAATRLYPEDANAEFALASVRSLLGDQAGASEALKRVIELEPDFTEAYAKLGQNFSSAGDWQNALRIFRQGLRIDPLSAELNRGLGLALTQGGDASAGDQALALAEKLGGH